jgi:dTDP-4-amino-4,6-dideoxygalactose transaminase
MGRLFLSPPHMGDDERRLLLEAFDSNWIAPLGEHVDRFEEEVAALAGVPHAAALSSGTAGLHLALHLLGVGRGDEVLVSSFTFVATANPIVYLGARPTFLDSEASSWNMDPALLAEVLDDRARAGRLPKAVIVADLYGRCAAYDRIVPLCEQHGVPLIEDAAEALGATYRGAAAGSFGRYGIFSFNGNKIITTSGGGMFVSRDERDVDRVRFLSQQARDPAPHYQHAEIGFNYRLSNLLAAVGRGQLRGLPAKIKRRREINASYREALAAVPGIDLPEVPLDEEPNWWLTCITIDPAEFGADREAVRLALEVADIESRPLWKPLHLQPLYADAEMVGGAVSEEAFAKGLCLPSGSAMTDGDIDRVVDAILAARP